MKRLFAMFCLLATWAQAAPTAADGYTHVRTVGSIDEYTLKSNGLQVLLLPEHASPTLTFMVTYRVGSKNEVTGTTGATHILEHMMFKGTKNRERSKGNNVDQLLERTGARYNATTWLDRTNYYQTLGSEHLATVADMEADRMRNLLLRDSDRQPEMTVVRNEFERGENSPFQALYKEIYQAAFVAHPYHHSTIGHRSDIEKVSIQKLREFYDTFYWPNNATVTVIGDFQPAKALTVIKKSFGVYPKSPKPIPALYTEEPEQLGPRRVVVKRPGQLGLIAIAHKIPQAMHPDYPAVALLDAILTDGKNSRMYKAITDKNLSTGVDSDVGYNADPSLQMIFVPLAPGASHEEVEKIALQEIERVKKDGVTEAELKSAVAKTLANAAFKRDGSFAVAGNLNESIAAGDWTLYYKLDEAVSKITVADIQRVANTYMLENRSTTGWFVPTETGIATSAPEPKAHAASLIGPSYYRNPALETLGANQVQRSTTKGDAPVQGVKMAPLAKQAKVAGIDLVSFATGVKKVITLRGALPAAQAQSTGNPAIATLTAMLLDQGTVRQDKFAIAQQLESVGASLGFHAGTDMLDISAKLLKKDLSLVLGLMAEQLRSPAFTAGEFAKAKKQYVGSVKRSLESTDFRAADAFSRIVFPVGHPNRGTEPEALLAAIEAAKLEDVIAFHKAHYGPAHMVLVAVGDVDAEALQSEVAKAFDGWRGGSTALRKVTTPTLQTPPEVRVEIPGKTSVSVVIGQGSGLHYQHPDYLAMRLGTAILGSGFTGRLMANVRDKEGLTYGIDAGLDGDSFNSGQWAISASFAPNLLDKGIASTQRQLDKWYQDGVTASELASRKANLVGSFQVSLSTTSGLANAFLAALNRGYPLNWVDEYPDRIRAITQAQVNSVIQKYLQPQNMVLVKAGSLAEAKK